MNDLRMLASFIDGFNYVQKSVYDNAVDKGFWEQDKNDGEAIALMHSELSEALEAIRGNDPMDDKVPQHKNSTVELADCIIRIMDFAQARGMNLSQALLDKALYNTTRPYKHGKKF